MLMFSLSAVLVVQLCTAQSSVAATNEEYEDYTLVCPEDDGFYADSLQCDKYYECEDGVPKEKLCPDGLVFDEKSKESAICSFPSVADCKGRPERQEPIPSENCPRQNGYFPDADPEICNEFNFCNGGVANHIVCPSGLVFDLVLGNCGWIKEVKREGCTAEEVKQKNSCPSKGGSPHEHTRYENPDDCTTFFLCIGGTTRKSGCEKGLVFNPETFSCERQGKVEGPCSTWYTEEELERIRFSDY